VTFSEKRYAGWKICRSWYTRRAIDGIRCWRTRSHGDQSVPHFLGPIKKMRGGPFGCFSCAFDARLSAAKLMERSRHARRPPMSDQTKGNSSQPQRHTCAPMWLSQMRPHSTDHRRRTDRSWPRSQMDADDLQNRCIPSTARLINVPKARSSHWMPCCFPDASMSRRAHSEITDVYCT